MWNWIDPHIVLEENGMEAFIKFLLNEIMERHFFILFHVIFT